MLNIARKTLRTFIIFFLEFEVDVILVGLWNFFWQEHDLQILRGLVDEKDSFVIEQKLLSRAV